MTKRLPKKTKPWSLELKKQSPSIIPVKQNAKGNDSQENEGKRKYAE